MGLHAAEQIACAGEGFLGSFAAAHNQENAIGFYGENHGVGGGHDGRRIDDDKFELGAKFGDGVVELVRREQVGGIGRERAGGNGGKIGDGGVLDGDEVEAGNSGEEGTEAGVLAAAEAEEAADAGLAQIGIDEQGAIAELGESDSKIGGGSGLALARQSAGYQDDLGRMIGLRKKERGAQGAKRFGHLRLREMLGDEFDALVVTVGGGALEQFGAGAVAIRFAESGNDGEGRQAYESFDIVRALDGVVHVLAKEGQTNAADETDYERQGYVAGFGGARGIGGDHGGIDDANIGGAQTGGNTGFF